MIYQVCPFNNENLITSIHIEENKGQVDKFFLIEANRTFQNTIKEESYKLEDNSAVEHVFYDVSKDFVSPNFFGKIKLLKYRIRTDGYSNILALPAWYNDGFQRNIVHKIIQPKDEDIVILSDVDEIIKAEEFENVVEKTKKYGIVTGKLYYTLFGFNLFSRNWGGAPDYSYRLFSMTGKHFNNMKMTADELRKRGERGELINDIYCIKRFIGFHHSWLGDEEFVNNKLKSYAHIDEHKGMNSRAFIKQCLEEKKSLYPGQILEIDNEIELMKSVEKLRNLDEAKPFFF